jgi:hypothetical protein
MITRGSSPGQVLLHGQILAGTGSVVLEIAQALVREIDEELRAAIDEATMAHVVTVQARGDGGDSDLRMICYTAEHRGDLVPWGQRARA